MISCIAHKIDVQQGNVVTEEMLQNIHEGMPAQKVKNIIGTPLIVDPFRKDRWEYVYSIQIGSSKERQFSYITLFFKENILDKIQINEAPLKESELKSLAKKSKENI